jgi:hypothetical protein
MEMIQAGQSGRTSWEDDQRGSNEDDGGQSGYDPRSSEEYDGNQYESGYDNRYSTQRVNGIMGNPVDRSGSSNGGPAGGGGGAGAGGGMGYSVASTHDYLGYPKDQHSFGQQGLWDDEEKTEDLW